VALDPIVSLSVAIAEAPGSHAFFLGSGVSRDAGVPTGAEVFWQAVGELYRLENASQDTPDQGRLKTWLDEAGRGELGYSDVLVLITPDLGTRRDYLAKHFEGVEPGPTHERLAELAARRLVKVFVTTNFDRLLEHALQARGIEPVVITSPEDLQRAPAREHASCYVLKPHGDYLQQTIRNTPTELAELDSDVDRELREVFDRYGVVVLGYSGSDEAIATAMRERRSRYGFYWVARGPLPTDAQAIVEAVGGRLIVRDGAAEFLADLDRRLAVFQQHPSGMTPLTVHDQAIALLRRGDTVGLRELLRAERREFESHVDEVFRGRQSERLTVEVVLDCHTRLLPAFERRLATLLPLVLHDAELFADEFAGLTDFVANQEPPNGLTFWFEGVNYAAWWLGFAIGAFAVRERRLGALRPLFTAEIRNPYGRDARALVGSVPGETGDKIGHVVMSKRSEKRWIAPWFQALKLDLDELALLRERYPEWVEREGELNRTLVHFDFLLTMALALAHRRAIAHWSMYTQTAEALARRLYGERQFRAAVAESLGISLEEFDNKAADALDGIHLLGDNADHDAITILKTGSA
jgi:SIR2-like domain